MTRARTILLLILAAGLSLAGCSRKSTPRDDESLTIAVIPKGTIHQF